MAVIADMEDSEVDSPIAAQLDLLGKQLAANALARETILTRQTAWQRGQ